MLKENQMKTIVLLVMLLSGCYSVVSTETYKQAINICDKNNSALMYILVAGREYNARCSNGKLYEL